MITHTFCIINIDHQHNLVWMVVISKIVDGVAIIKNVYHAIICFCSWKRIPIAISSNGFGIISTSVKIVDMLLVISYGQQVHIVTAVRSTISTLVSLFVACLRFTGSTFIYLLHKEVGKVWIFVF